MPDPAPPRTSAAAAYLQHLQSKNTGAAPESNSRSNKDPRQTIVSPASKERNLVRLSQQLTEVREDPPPLVQLPMVMRKSKRSPRSDSRSPGASHSRRGSGPKNGAVPTSKPPLCKQTRSVISEATNSTYLSSDSEEDCTVRSDASASISAFSGSSFHSGSSKSRKSRRSCSSIGEANDASAGGAMVPYEPPEDHPATTLNANAAYYPRRPVVSTDADDLADVADAVFSYSDEEDYYYHHHRHTVSDDSSIGLLPVADESDDDDDTLADLDQLIQETSARWKQTVTEAVKNTVTATTLQQQQQRSLVAEQELSAVSPNSSSSRETADSTNNKAPTDQSSFRLVQQQQAEIEALRAALQQQQQFKQQHHVHPIQVLTVAADHAECIDDLTVWSGFQSAAPQRPDAASVVADDFRLPRGAPSSATAAAKPPQPTTTTVKLELSSAVTGITRTAIFTGTLLSSSSSSFDNVIAGTGVLQFVETGDVYRGEIVDSEMHGRGTYAFAVSKKSTKPPKILRGQFEHNVFVG